MTQRSSQPKNIFFINFQHTLNKKSIISNGFDSILKRKDKKCSSANSTKKYIQIKKNIYFVTFLDRKLLFLTINSLKNETKD